MADRFINKVAIDAYDFVLTSGAVAVQGELACGVAATGKVSPVTVGSGQVPLGFFTRDMTGDGTTKIHVQLFKQVNAYLFTNDATTPVANAFTHVYAKNGSSVSSDATSSNTAIGMAIEVTTAGVLVVPVPLGM